MADMDLLLFEVASALKSTVDSEFPEFDHLKLEQVLSIVQFVMQKDVFLVLPTGFGKSVIFQVIPSICFRTFSFMLSSILYCFTGLHVRAVIRKT